MTAKPGCPRWGVVRWKDGLDIDEFCHASYSKMTHRRWRGATGFVFFSNFGKCIRTQTHTGTRKHTCRCKVEFCYPVWTVCLTWVHNYLLLSVVSHQLFDSQWIGSEKKQYKHTNQQLRHYRDVNVKDLLKFFILPWPTPYSCWAVWQYGKKNAWLIMLS